MSKVIAIIAVAALVCGLGGCSSQMMTAPVSAPKALGAPQNAPPNECVTDEGYGRWQPCGNMS